MLLWRRNEPNWLAIVPDVPKYRTDPPADGRLVGPIQKGTPATIVKVIEFNYGMAMAASDLHFTFARIEAGPYAGRVVEVNEAGLQILPSFHPGPAHVDRQLVEPCEGRE